jgi:rhodanese-related sulfurtransferase
MRNLLFVLVLATPLAACTKAANDPAPAATAPELVMTSIDEVDHGLAAGDCQAVDANSDMTRKHMGTLPGAVLLTDSDNYKPTELPADKAKPLVFYCGGTECMASHGAANRAIALGYKNVKVMPGGISGWVKAGKKVQSI